MTLQQTLLRNTTVKGKGLHSGLDVEVGLWPAPVDAGIVFQLKQSGVCREIPAIVENVTSTQLATRLAISDSCSVGTVEHLMAALVGCGIDNCIVEVEGSEIPALDGSALGFVQKIKSAGVKKQHRPAREIRITHPIAIDLDGASIGIEPWDCFAIDMTIEFERPYFRNGPQRLVINNVYDNFISELASARTFAFAEDVVELKKKGYALGGSLSNAILIDGNGIVNADGLRYSDELLRHKMLDIVGDLFLTGCRLVGKITAYKSGHRMNCRLASEIMKSSGHWDRSQNKKVTRRVCSQVA